MYKRIPLALLLALLSWGCGRPSEVPIVKTDDQTFSFGSVVYTANGKQHSTKFKNGSAQISIGSVKNDIIIQGSYGPGDSAVTVIEIGVDPVISVNPKFKDGKWSATIDANTLQTNIFYDLKAKVKDGGSIASAELGISAN